MKQKYPGVKFGSWSNPIEQLSIADIERVADAVRILSEVFVLHHQEVAERIAFFMTEREFERVLEEFQNEMD